MEIQIIQSHPLQQQLVAYAEGLDSFGILIMMITQHAVHVEEQAKFPLPIIVAKYRLVVEITIAELMDVIAT